MLGVKGYTLVNRRGIMARFLVQLVMVGIQTVSRAFTQALRQEYQATMAARRAAEEAGRDGIKAAQAASYTGISLQEAQQILNIKDIDDIDIIRKNYEHLFKVNDKAAGGSFYLQSKVVRAKERIEMELDEKVCPDPTPNDDTSSHSTHNSDSKS